LIHIAADDAMIAAMPRAMMPQPILRRHAITDIDTTATDAMPRPPLTPTFCHFAGFDCSHVLRRHHATNIFSMT